MRKVGLFEAKQKLSELVERAAAGERIGHHAPRQAGRGHRFRQGPVRSVRDLRELGRNSEKSAPSQRRERKRPY